MDAEQHRTEMKTLKSFFDIPRTHSLNSHRDEYEQRDAPDETYGRGAHPPARVEGAPPLRRKAEQDVPTRRDEREREPVEEHDGDLEEDGEGAGEVSERPPAPAAEVVQPEDAERARAVEEVDQGQVQNVHGGWVGVALEAVSMSYEYRCMTGTSGLLRAEV